MGQTRNEEGGYEGESSPYSKNIFSFFLSLIALKSRKNETFCAPGAHTLWVLVFPSLSSCRNFDDNIVPKPQGDLTIIHPPLHPQALCFVSSFRLLSRRSKAKITKHQIVIVVVCRVPIQYHLLKLKCTILWWPQFRKYPRASESSPRASTEALSLVTMPLGVTLRAPSEF